MRKLETMAILALAASVIGVQAGLVSGTASNDNVLQGNFETGAANVFLTNNSNRDRVGTGGAGTQQRVNQPVLGFTLPNLGAGESVSAATFSFKMTPAASVTGAPLGFDMVISLMNQTSIAGFTASDFLEATAPVNTALGNGVVIGQLAVSDVSDDQTVNVSLTGAALSQFASLYDGAGNPSQSEVWFRLSTSATIDITDSNNDNDRFNLNDTGGSVIRSLEITTIPEPATLGLIAAFGGGILFIRRRFTM